MGELAHVVTAVPVPELLPVPTTPVPTVPVPATTVPAPVTTTTALGGRQTTSPAVTEPPTTTTGAPPTTVAPKPAAPSWSPVAPAGAWFDGASEWEFLRLTNVERAGIGAGQLERNLSLDAYARAHAVAMMGRGRVHHSSIADLLVGTEWWSIGENVGVGPSPQPIQDALLASPTHYANIGRADYSAMGVGVVVGPASLADGSGAIWTVHIFAGR